MTVEQHLQQLIGVMAFQLAQKCAEVDELRKKVDSLKPEPVKAPDE